MEADLSDDVLSQLSAVVARITGLHFPQERWLDLQRGITAAASDLGFEKDARRCLHWLATDPALSKQQFESLAAHLTVGETYFFRERRHFEFLTQRILPELMKRDGERRLRIWSAACCTGEEAYSIAISLRRTIPDLESWQVTVLATDINPLFLRKAETGVFGQWSFRDAPDWLKPQYFRPLSNGQFEVSPQIKKMVKFTSLNLAVDAYPSLLNDAHAMDVVFCRNVLMYFSPTLIRKVVENIHRTQREGGWLFVSSSELLHMSASPYTTVNAPDVVAYRKGPAPPTPFSPPIALEPFHFAASKNPLVPLLEIPPPIISVEEPPDPHAIAATLYAEGRYQEAATTLQASLSPPAEHADVPTLNLLARCLANQGQSAEALIRCDQSIAVDKCNATTHYLRALILQEQGMIDQAILSLRNALYVEPNFVLAHVTLGTISRDRGKLSAAQKHLKHALEMLQPMTPDAILPESEGTTAGQLIHMIHSLLHEEAIP